MMNDRSPSTCSGHSSRLGILLVALAVNGGCKKEAPPLPSASVDLEAPAPRASATTSAAGSTAEFWTGSTFPIRQAAVSSKVTGVLAEMKVEAGDIVEKGDLLFRVDASQAALQTAQALAGVRSAEVNVSSAQTDYDRAKRLSEKKVIGDAELEKARVALEAAKAGLAQANAGLALAQSGVIDTSMKAPISGVVAERNNEKGESVMGAGPPVLVIQDISSLEVRARIHESALQRVRMGSRMLVTIPALKLQREAVVTRIHPAVDPTTRTIEVVGIMPNASGELRAGMFVETRFEDATGAATPAPGLDTSSSATASAKPAAKK